MGLKGRLLHSQLSSRAVMHELAGWTVRNDIHCVWSATCSVPLASPLSGFMWPWNAVMDGWFDCVYTQTAASHFESDSTPRHQTWQKLQIWVHTRSRVPCYCVLIHWAETASKLHCTTDKTLPRLNTSTAVATVNMGNITVLIFRQPYRTSHSVVHRKKEAGGEVWLPHNRLITLEKES